MQVSRYYSISCRIRLLYTWAFPLCPGHASPLVQPPTSSANGGSHLEAPFVSGLTPTHSSSRPRSMKIPERGPP